MSLCIIYVFFFILYGIYPNWNCMYALDWVVNVYTETHTNINTKNTHTHTYATFIRAHLHTHTNTHTKNTRSNLYTHTHRRATMNNDIIWKCIFGENLNELKYTSARELTFCANIWRYIYTHTHTHTIHTIFTIYHMLC